MPGTLIFAIIFAVIAVVATLFKMSAAREVKQYENREGGPPRTSTGTGSGRLTDYGLALRAKDILSWIARSFTGFAVLLLIIGSVTIIPTKKVGVVTTFGAPSGSLSNGLHLIWPWQKVTTLDGAIQTDNFVNDEKTKDNESTTIRLGNQSTASVGNSVRWRLRPGRADSLYRDYRDFDNIRDSLVTREKNAALNEVFKNYDPLSTIKEQTKGEENPDNSKTPTAPVSPTPSVRPDKNGCKPVEISTTGQPTLDELGAAVTYRLCKRIGADIQVLNVIIPLIQFDQETQGRINAYQAEIANTRIAEQRKATATKNAAANRALSSSVSNNPNVLVSRCIEALESMIKENQPVPAGFNCWPGNGSTLALPTTRGR